MRIPRRLLTIIPLFLIAGGCATNPQARLDLQAGEQAYSQQNYEQAIRCANAALGEKDSDVLAQAHYLRGRAVEDRQKINISASNADLQTASADYSAALDLQPSRTLEGFCRMQLGNVLYRQGRYADALEQWTMCDPLLDRGDLKMWEMYYSGICEQRLSRFEDADATFERVQQMYPNTEPASRAHQREGLRGFYVQIGAFSDSEDAERAASTLLAAGVMPLKTTARNLTVIRTVNVATYSQAVALQSRLASAYPDASVVP
ncbi:MAG: SPOR domain-containing protein [Tepidisphaeraceae bacterium]|jgi:tetratricopeptide (TPR) repeat protein